MSNMTYPLDVVVNLISILFNIDLNVLNLIYGSIKYNKSRQVGNHSAV